MATTILYGHASDGGHTSRSYTSREETPAEAGRSRRAAELAYRATGLPPQPVRVFFYGDRALVRFAGGRAVWVQL
jgi:hypothetical protein